MAGLTQNAVKRTVKVGPDLGVCYADDSQAEGLQHEFPFLVTGVLYRVQVDAAVDFEDQPQLGAVEVSNEGADGVLAAELEAAEAAVADSFPDERFGVREWAPQTPRRWHVVTVGSLAV